jgi:bifunctional DNase/RNase
MAISSLMRRRVLAAACLLLLIGAPPGQTRELAAERAAFVEAEIAGVGITTAGVPAVLLRPVDTDEVIPIFIGPGQARAIIMALHERQPPRPLTHDLMNRTLGALKARLDRVYVDDVRDNTFLGMLELTVAGRQAPVLVDSRPSDALALALRAGASVHVSPRVLEAARSLEHGGLEEKVVQAAGITVNAATPKLRQALELPDAAGVLVSEATGPAHQAGMRSGALITGVNGETPETPEAFRKLMEATPTGEKARIRFWQQGDERSIRVPAQLPDQRRASRPLGSARPLNDRG